MSDERKELQAFAEAFDYCFVCWSRDELQIHHLSQGSGRRHVRENLCRICFTCHDRLHFVGGRITLTKGQVLNAKRLADPLFFSEKKLAELRGRVGLSYVLEPLPAWALHLRRRRISPSVVSMGEQVMACNSRKKGSRGELEAAHELNAVLPGAQARRAQQYSGTEGTSDLIAPGIPGLWLEVKRRQSLNLQRVIEESLGNCGQLAPVVLHRKDNAEWLITFRVSDIPKVIEEMAGAR